MFGNNTNVCFTTMLFCLRWCTLYRRVGGRLKSQRTRPFKTVLVSKERVSIIIIKKHATHKTYTATFVILTRKKKVGSPVSCSIQYDDVITMAGWLVRCLGRKRETARMVGKTIINKHKWRVYDMGVNFSASLASSGSPRALCPARPRFVAFSDSGEMSAASPACHQRRSPLHDPCSSCMPRILGWLEECSRSTMTQAVRRLLGISYLGCAFWSFYQVLAGAGICSFTLALIFYTSKNQLTSMPVFVHLLTCDT